MFIEKIKYYITELKNICLMGEGGGGMGLALMAQGA